MSEQAYFSAQNDYPALSGNSGREFIDRYSRAPVYASQHPMHAPGYTQVSQMHVSNDYHKLQPYVPRAPVHYQYGKMTGASGFPSTQARDFPVDQVPAQYPMRDSHVPSLQKPKDDVPSGGVAAHLDYDIELMANFVAEMAQGIVHPGSRPAPQFQKYVFQILSSTRLPSSTIILGLFYLASRMRILSDSGGVTHCSATVYRMLTTCLLLGSKFLDDNTFQNRSWADVSSIPVSDLNKMELEWLKGFDWTLHGPMYNETEGFYTWREHWKAYQEDAQLARARESRKLAPIDTTVARIQQSVGQPLMSPEGPIPLQYQRSSQYDTQWVRSLISDYSPPSAPHSGPTTPEYYPNGNWPQAPPPYSRQTWASNNTPVHAPHPSQPPSYQHTPSYAQGHFQSVWHNHGPSCICPLCAKHGHYFSHPTAYGIQSVAG